MKTQVKHGSSKIMKLGHKKNNDTMHLKERGADMIQVGLYAIAALIVMILAFMLYTQFTSANKTKEHITNIKMLNAGVYNLFHQQGLRNYTSITTASVAKTNATPEGFKDGNAITNEWSGNITLGAAGNSFTITDKAIPLKECIDIILGSYTDFASVKVGAKTITKATAATAPSDAILGCASATNTIIYTH